MKIRKRSLDDINQQFKNVLTRLGIDSDQQLKMQDLSLDLKMKVIISLDSECSKEQNIKIFLEMLSTRNSLLNILSLKSIMDEGLMSFYSAFKANNGIKILEDLTYKILFDSNNFYEPNKALHEKFRYENDQKRSTGWYDEDFNLQYDFQLYYSLGKSKNMCNTEFAENSRENMINVILGCIVSIVKKYNCYDFDVCKIVKNCHLFVYTKYFYELIDLYSTHCIEKLDFLFTSNKNHLCTVNTYFYDIYCENYDFPAVTNFLNNEKYQNIVSYICCEIRNEKKKGLMNSKGNTNEKPRSSKVLGYNEITKNGKDDQLFEKTEGYCREKNELKILKNEKEGHLFLGSAIENTICNALNDRRAETKNKLCRIIDSIENEKLIAIIPCFLESFIMNPESIKEKNDFLELKKEIEKLKQENERLQLAVVNMDNKNLVSPIDNKNEEISIKNEQKKVTEVVEQKINNMNIKPKKMPFKRSVKKETNVFLVPYSKKTYYPIRWCKTTKDGNIWEDINKDLKYENLTQIFPLDDLSCYEKKLTVTDKPAKEMNKVRTCLPQKKGYALSIALGRLKMPDQEFKMHVFQLNECKFSENLIKQLINNYPETKEFELLKSLKLDIKSKSEVIGRAEEFFFEFLYCHEEFYQNLTAMYFKMTYPSNSKSIKEMIIKLSQIYTRALESSAIREFLQYTLFIGNIFNGNTFSGNAEGYSLESLSAFIDYTGNNKEKLIDEIVNKMQYNLISDLKYLTSDNIKYDGLCIQMADLAVDFERIKMTEEIITYLKPLISNYEALKLDYQELNAIYAKFNKFYNGENVLEVFKTLLEVLQKRK